VAASQLICVSSRLHWLKWARLFFGKVHHGNNWAVTSYVNLPANCNSRYLMANGPMRKLSSRRQISLSSQLPHLYFHVISSHRPDFVHHSLPAFLHNFGSSIHGIEVYLRGTTQYLGTSKRVRFRVGSRTRWSWMREPVSVSRAIVFLIKNRRVTNQTSIWTLALSCMMKTFRPRRLFLRYC
jgi:hypothetical protein